jgi:long-chain acyl-CoA synthetase
MSDPLSYLPYTLAARDGSVDGILVRQLVSAGFRLLQRSAPVVRALAGRRAAILLPTCPQFFTALAASDGRGAVLINPLASPSEVAYQVADAGAGAVFTTRALAAGLDPALPAILLDEAPRRARVRAGGREVEVDLESHEGLRIEGLVDVPGADEEAAVVYTSAMEGYPLGAVLTHRNLLANARSAVTAAGLSAADHSLAILPFTHLFGLTVSGVAPLLAGGRVTTMVRFSPGRAVDLLEVHGITLLVGVPAVFAALLSVVERRGTPLRAPSLRVCICGGAPLPVAWQDRWFELAGVELRQGYGLTEAGPVCLFNSLGAPNKRGTLGIPFPGVQVEVREPGSSRRADRGVVGEICVAGDNVSRGYLHGARAGLERAGAWLRTGDLGLERPDGTFEFRGVCKPMFTRNGFNIYPRELERVIGELPGVRAVRVSPLPEPTRENDIRVEVAGTATSADVQAWCEDRLAAYKQPGEVVVSEAGATGA